MRSWERRKPMTQKQLNRKLNKIEQRLAKERKLREGLWKKQDAIRKRINYWESARSATRERLGCVREGQVEMTI